MKMLKGIPILLLALLVLLSNVVYAADKRQLQNVTVFYCMDNGALEAMTGKVTVERGQKEVEELIAKKFKKRFNVSGVTRIYKNAEGSFTANDVMTASNGQTALVVDITLTGTRDVDVKYSNGFGAERIIKVPAVDMKYSEYLGVVNNGENQLLKLGEWHTTYRANTDIYGGIFGGVSYENPRAMVQSAIEYVIAVRGYYNPPNYYVMKDAFDAYTALYYLDKDFILAKVAAGEHIDVANTETEEATEDTETTKAE